MKQINIYVNIVERQKTSVEIFFVVMIDVAMKIKIYGAYKGVGLSNSMHTNSMYKNNNNIFIRHFIANRSTFDRRKCVNLHAFCRDCPVASQ